MNTECKIFVNNDLDIVNARMQARAMAKQVGFRTADQARISLAASELARVLSWGPNLPGEITMVFANHNGQPGLHVMCRVQYSGDSVDGRPTLRHSLTSACQLVDESIVEEQDNQHAHITLIKWLS